MFGPPLRIGAKLCTGQGIASGRAESDVQRIPGRLRETAMHYLLLYDVVPDYVERRAALRAEHLALAQAAHARGELVLGGARPIESMGRCCSFAAIPRPRPRPLLRPTPMSAMAS